MGFATLAPIQSCFANGQFYVATLICNESSQLVLLIVKLSSPLKIYPLCHLFFIVYDGFHRLPMCCV